MSVSMFLVLTFGALLGVTRVHAARLSDSRAAFIKSVVKKGKVQDDLKCSTASVAPVCKCNKAAQKGNLCNECKNKVMWGRGCDLECPMECGEEGCDIAGFCLKGLNSHCKENSRHDFDGKVNTFGTCAACERKWYGPMCDKQCRAGEGIWGNCAKSDAEGHCTRAGKCFKCKSGWYGDMCEKACPKGCPDCVMKDNTVLSQEQKGNSPVYLAAGACRNEQLCHGNYWGPTCENPCPENCKIRVSGGPTCDKKTGECVKCGGLGWDWNPPPNHQFWGPRCENTCQEGCEWQQCNKITGHCEKGVRPNGFNEDGVPSRGWWGLDGSKVCPKFTDGACNRDNGLPYKCAGDKFPGFRNDEPLCIGCGPNCKGGSCGTNGECLHGCNDGFHGLYCDQTCPPGCESKCTQDEGNCLACKGGLTGSKCEDSCHESCATCKQYDWKYASGTGSNQCTSCKADQPSYLNKNWNTCACIPNAEPGDNDVCACKILPNGMDNYFIAKPSKECRQKCKGADRMVFADNQVACVEKKVQKALYLNDSLDSYSQGKCNEGQLEIAGECTGKIFLEKMLKEIHGE